MSDPRREYVSSLVAESLGLPGGPAFGLQLADSLVDGVAASMAGEPTGDQGGPFLEEQLLEALERLEESQIRESGFSVRKMRWPGGSRLAVCLTHDVDNVSRPRLHILRTRGRFGASDLARGLLDPSTLYNNIAGIAREEEARGFRSSFYLLTSNYGLEPLRDVVTDLARRGWDIGLHGDFGTHDSRERMQEAIRRFSGALGFPPRGVREHFLRFEPKLTWGLMDSLGLDYDDTVGLNDRLGFKLGVSTPFHPPDQAWKPLSILELPLTLMDTTLWGYLRRDEEGGMADARRMLSQVEAVEGLFTLLWHQEAVKMKGGRLYWKLLDELRGRGCYVANAAEVARWWRARSAVLVRSDNNNSIAIDGPSPTGLRLMIRTEKSVTVERGGSVKPTDGGYVVDVAGTGGLLVKVS